MRSPIHENLLSGRNPIREALKSGRDIEKLLISRGELTGSAREILAMAKEQHVPIQEVDRVRLDAITPNHQGMLAFASAYQYHTVEEMLALASGTRRRALPRAAGRRDRSAQPGRGHPHRRVRGRARRDRAGTPRRGAYPRGGQSQRGRDRAHHGSARRQPRRPRWKRSSSRASGPMPPI